MMIVTVAVMCITAIVVLPQHHGPEVNVSSGACMLLVQMASQI